MAFRTATEERNLKTMLRSLSASGLSNLIAGVPSKRRNRAIKNRKKMRKTLRST